MNISTTLYPENPTKLPAGFLDDDPNLVLHTRLVFLALILFVGLYTAALAVLIGYLVNQISLIREGQPFSIWILVLSVTLIAIMLKAVLFRHGHQEIRGIEIDADSEPTLLAFIHQTADDVGTKQPRKVYLTPDMNAAVVYDLSWLNLFLPARKDLIIGLPLASQLTLSEFKALLSHEFGHFAQRTSALGRWVYTAQQVMQRFASGQDAIDNIIDSIIRLPASFGGMVFMFFGGWLLWVAAGFVKLVTWAIRTTFALLLRVLVMSSRALSRELEFQADQVAVSVTGSEQIVSILSKLPAIDHAWRDTLSIAQNQARRGPMVDDLIHLQDAVMQHLRRVLNDESYGRAPAVDYNERKKFRVFTTSHSNQSELWRSHPLDIDRENNAKFRYVDCEVDDRSAALLFGDIRSVGAAVSKLLSKESESKQYLNDAEAIELADARYNHLALDPKFNGCYLRAPVLQPFENVAQIFSTSHSVGRDELYPRVIQIWTEELLELNNDLQYLQRIKDGIVVPLNNEVQYRGKFLRTSELAGPIRDLQASKSEVKEKLAQHTVLCRSYYQALAQAKSSDAAAYHRSLVALLHYSTHTQARLMDNIIFLDNTERVIFADHRLTEKEKIRFVAVLREVDQLLREVSSYAEDVYLPDSISRKLGFGELARVVGGYDAPEPHMGNFMEWRASVRPLLYKFEQVHLHIMNVTLDLMLGYEETLQNAVELSTEEPAQVPLTYGVLLPGQEHVIQTKLDWLSRFRLSQGIFPILVRATASIAIIIGAWQLFEFEYENAFERHDTQVHQSALGDIDKVCGGVSDTQCINDSIKRLNGSVSEFIETLERACGEKNTTTCMLLATLYTQGDHIPQDTAIARGYLERGCADAHGNSCNRLAILLQDEEFGATPKLINETFEKACMLSDFHACSNLAFRLARNPEDAARLKQAETLAERACKNGVEQACEFDMHRVQFQHVAQLCAQQSTPTCVNRGAEFMGSPSAVLALFAQECNRGTASVCAFLGSIYADKESVHQNIMLALDYLGKACDAQLPGICNEAGVLADNFDQVNAESATLYFTKACTQDDHHGCYNLGRRQIETFFATRRHEEAEGYLRKACEADLYQACFVLGRHLTGIANGDLDRINARAHLSKACIGGIGEACQ